LNLAGTASSLITVEGYWQHSDAPSPTVVIAEPTDWTSVSALTMVTSNYEVPAAADSHTSEPTAPAIAPLAATSLAIESPADRKQQRFEIRFDEPHARNYHKPHAKFGVTQPSVPEKPKPVESSPLELADALASDLIPSAEEPRAATTTTLQPPVIETPSPTPLEQLTAKPTPPVWEVDRFHWPKTCERLLADPNGYLAEAGAKLHAAVQDGLRILAVTGSRRGEGRTTVALCLARSAAKVGVQVAVMDLDFARPQLASKLGLEVSYGWQDAALGKIPLSEAAITSIGDKITVLPLESTVVTRSLSLVDARVTATLRAAAATFELVILDLGPFAAGEEILFPFEERCPLDAAIVVRDLRFCSSEQSETIGHMLQDAGIEAVGIAENFAVEEEQPVCND